MSDQPPTPSNLSNEIEDAAKKTVEYLYEIKGEVDPVLYQAIATLRQLINEEFKPQRSLSSQFIYDILNPALTTLFNKQIVEALLDELNFLLDDFGIEDNVEPIKQRIKVLEGADNGSI